MDFKSITLWLIAMSIAFGADEATDKQPSFADEAYARALDSSTKKAEFAYGNYTKELEAANQSVIKALEAYIKDLNDPKKFLKLDMKQRANYIEDIETKIAEVKKNAIGELFVAKQVAKNSNEGAFNESAKGDLKTILVGKWKRSDGNIFVFNLNGTGLMTGGQSDSLRWIIVKKTVKVTFDTHPGWWQEMTMVDNMTFSTVRDDGGTQAMTKEPK